MGALLPGEQAQVDWEHFGKLTVGTVGEDERPLVAFVMVLSGSRQIFVRSFPSAAIAWFLRRHVCAFDTLRGVPHVLLCRNLKRHRGAPA